MSTPTHSESDPPDAGPTSDDPASDDSASNDPAGNDPNSASNDSAREDPASDDPAANNDHDPTSDETDPQPPDHTSTEIVPVSVPRAVEAEARSRAGRLNEAVEDVLADHVTVVPDYCFSPVEGDRVPAASTRRVALHTTVEPELASAVDGLADDRREWIREAIEEKIGRERGGDEEDGVASSDRDPSS